MIKCTELQIGSIVRLEDVSEPLQVVDIQPENATLVHLDSRSVDDYYYVWDHELYPIPITEALLERNGWFYKAGYWTKKGPIRLSWNQKTSTLIAGYWTVPVVVEFVHTLQHIIRLLGLEQEDIVL